MTGPRQNPETNKAELKCFDSRILRDVFNALSPESLRSMPVRTQPIFGSNVIMQFKTRSLFLRYFRTAFIWLHPSTVHGMRLVSALTNNLILYAQKDVRHQSLSSMFQASVVVTGGKFTQVNQSPHLYECEQCSLIRMLRAQHSSPDCSYQVPL